MQCGGLVSNQFVRLVPPGKTSPLPSWKHLQPLRHSQAKATSVKLSPQDWQQLDLHKRSHQGQQGNGLRTLRGYHVHRCPRPPVAPELEESLGKEAIRIKVPIDDDNHL